MRPLISDIKRLFSRGAICCALTSVCLFDLSGLSAAESLPPVATNNVKPLPVGGEAESNRPASSTDPQQVDYLAAHQRKVVESPIYPKLLSRQLGELLPNEQARKDRLLFELVHYLQNEPARIQSLLPELEAFEHLIEQEIKQKTSEVSGKGISQKSDATSSDNQFQDQKTDQNSAGRFLNDWEEARRSVLRHRIFWELSASALQANGFPAISLSTKGRDEAESLLKHTGEVCRYLRARERIRFGQPWIESLELDAFIDMLSDLCLPAEGMEGDPTVPKTIPISLLVALCDRANILCRRLEAKELTPLQQRFMNAVPLLRQWKTHLEGWQGDTVDPIRLLAAIESYETTRASAEMDTLARLATRLSNAKTAEYRKLGEAALDVYSGANIKIYVSEVLINHLLPSEDSRTVPFRDIIMGQQVVGRSTTDTNMQISMIPDPNRLAFSLDVNGKVDAVSRTNAWITTLFNSNHAVYEGSKQLLWTEEGIIPQPVTVSVRNRTQLRGIRSEIENVPFLANLVREIVRNQYFAREDRVRNESRQRVSREVSVRINREADQRFAEINDKYRDAVLKPMSDLGLFVENKGSSTNKDWLLSSWRLGAVGALGSHVPAPITQAGAFADLKVHESAINTLIARMELGGKTLSVGEMRDMIEEKINRPGALGEGENDDSIICLSDRNPIVVGFLNGKIRIALSIELLKTRDWSFRHITVTVHYKTDSDKITGEPYLVRDGAISVSGMVKVRDRIPIYAVFNKIFPEQRVIPLTPETIRHDPRFEGLTTGMCRLSDGWFAIALVAEPENPAKARTTNQTVQSP